jgi:hypothetical protein
MKYRKKKIPRPIAGEGPPGAVGSMCAGSQAKSQHTRLRIAKRGHRPAPVFVVCIRAFFRARHFGAICAQPHAAIAGNDAFIQRF